MKLCTHFSFANMDFVNVYRALLDVHHMYSMFLSFEACLAPIQGVKLARRVYNTLVLLCTGYGRPGTGGGGASPGLHGEAVTPGRVCGGEARGQADPGPIRPG